MNRREFIAGLGSAAVWPLAARAQQAVVPVIGFLHQGTFNERMRPVVEAFREGLADMGFVEGRTVSSTGGRRIVMTGCRLWLTIWFAGK